MLRRWLRIFFQGGSYVAISTKKNARGEENPRYVGRRPPSLRPIRRHALQVFALTAAGRAEGVEAPPLFPARPPLHPGAFKKNVPSIIAAFHAASLTQIALIREGNLEAAGQALIFFAPQAFTPRKKASFLVFFLVIRFALSQKKILQ